MDVSITSSILLIGVGNEQRGDDAIGLLAARRIQSLNLPGVSVIECRGEAGDLIERWKSAPIVFLIDAVRSGNPVGTLLCWDVNEEPLPANIFAVSSHSFGVAHAIELARVLHQLPPALVVYGIEGDRFEKQTDVSPELTESLEKIVHRIQSDLMQFIEKRS